MFTVIRNGRTVAIVEADDFVLDTTGGQTTLVFIKGDQAARIEENVDTNTPYLDSWQPAEEAMPLEVVREAVEDKILPQEVLEAAVELEEERVEIAEEKAEKEAEKEAKEAEKEVKEEAKEEKKDNG